MSLLAGVPAALGAALPAELPSPSVGVWHLGPLPVRGYALCILAGIVVAVWLTQKRLEARGHRKGVAIDISAWAVPFGIVGGRLYHLITTPQPYFGAGRRPVEGLRHLRGRPRHLGRRRARRRRRAGSAAARTASPSATSSTPPRPASRSPRRWAASATGSTTRSTARPTDLPWRLRIYEWDTSLGRAVVDAQGNPVVKGYFHPTFLYEALWCLLLAAFLIWLGRRVPLKAGQVFAAYVMGYPVGRIVIENMRSDSANLILGQRVNTWVSILVFLLGRLPVAPLRPDGAAGPAPDDPRPAPGGAAVGSARRRASSGGRRRRSFGAGRPRQAERHRCQRRRRWTVRRSR